jgi:hypothetical protein
MTEFTVDPSVLHDHASQVAAVANEVQVAAGAAAQVGLGGSDYGVIISPIMGALLPHLIPNMSGAIKTSANLADAMVDGLRDNSDVYQGVEDDLNQTIQSVDN